MSNNDLLSESSDENLIGKGPFGVFKESFLGMLDDKNKAIASLKEQLQNQKIQLMYYFQKNLGKSKLRKLSESCSLENVREYMPIVLALDKFKKDNGMKSSLHRVYERMCYVDKRIENLLHIQELVLKNVVTKVYEYVKHVGKYTLHDFIKDPCQIDLFNNLLEATCSLRKQLEVFKISCDRLLAIEDERNSIADQVFSLPVEQRIECNHLLSVQMENTELTRQIERLLKTNQMMNDKMKELTHLEEKIFYLQDQVNSFSSEDDHLGVALERIHCEANDLLQLTEGNKNKRHIRSKQNGYLLNKFLQLLRCALELNNSPNSVNLHEYSASELRTIEKIKRMILSTNKAHGSSLEKECEMLNKRLNEVFADRERLERSLVQLQSNYNSVTYNQQTKIQQLQQECDVYKQQVADLEVIREAYAQLVDRQPDLAKLSQDRQVNIDKLEQQNGKLQKKVTLLKNIVNGQVKEIDSQKQIIRNLRCQRDEQFKHAKNTSFRFLNRSVSFSDSCDYRSSSSRRRTSQDTYEYSREIIVEENYKKGNGVLKAKINSFSVIRHSSPNSTLSLQNLHTKTQQFTNSKISSCLEFYVQKSKTNKNVPLLSLMGNRKADHSSTAAEKEYLDEFELMRDCSRESIAVVCSPVRPRKRNGEATQKRVEVLAYMVNKVQSSSDENVYVQLKM